MQKTKNGEPLKELTTNQFAEKILNSPNKIFCFLTKPNDDYCYFLASVDLFGTQTVIINAGRFISKDIVSCPGGAYAFNITCYDVQFGYADKAECIPDIKNGLNDFVKLNLLDNNTWHVSDDGDISTLETIHHWK